MAPASVESRMGGRNKNVALSTLLLLKLGDQMLCPYIIQTASNFDVFLTVHHSIDYSKYQLNAQLFYSSTIYVLHYPPQHVSSSTLLIIRRINCITTASGIVTLCKQPYSMRVESGLW